MYLKTQGINPEEHPVKQEIARIQLYFKKLKEKQRKVALENQPTNETSETSINSTSETKDDNSSEDGDNKKRKNKATDNKQRKKKK